MNGFGINDREQVYFKVKRQPKNGKYAYGSVEAKRVRLMEGRLPTGEMLYMNRNMLMICVSVGQRKLGYMCCLSTNAIISWGEGG